MAAMTQELEAIRLAEEEGFGEIARAGSAADSLDLESDWRTQHPQAIVTRARTRAIATKEAEETQLLLDSTAVPALNEGLVKARDDRCATDSEGDGLFAGSMSSEKSERREKEVYLTALMMNDQGLEEATRKRPRDRDVDEEEEEESDSDRMSTGSSEEEELEERIQSRRPGTQRRQRGQVWMSLHGPAGQEGPSPLLLEHLYERAREDASKARFGGKEMLERLLADEDAMMEEERMEDDAGERKESETITSEREEIGREVASMGDGTALMEMDAGSEAAIVSLEWVPQSPEEREEPFL
eukprot:GHVU01105840.1.p1 GENE.GHVU01105840.1~~GHVU01105840.1.p1  ORF type:complete len:349 (-),score=83.16 GHVU01105840.1:78-974(-)